MFYIGSKWSNTVYISIVHSSVLIEHTYRVIGICMPFLYLLLFMNKLRSVSNYKCLNYAITHILATYNVNECIVLTQNPKNRSPILFYFVRVVIAIIKINVKILAKSFLTTNFQFSFCRHAVHSLSSSRYKKLQELKKMVFEYI